MENYPKTITLYKGHHSPEALAAFKETYSNNDLILYLPPTLKNYDFVQYLPKAKLQTLGELWTGDEVLANPEGPAADVVTGVFSSGTSQEPRLVLYSKKNLEASVYGIFELFDRDFLRKIYCYPQPYHTFGVTLGYAAATILNLELITPQGAYSRSHHEQWLQSIDPFTLTLGTPTHFYDLLDFTKALDSIPQSFSCIIGGAKVKAQLWHDCQQVLNISKPSIGYGATEASPGITHLPPGAPPFEDGEIGVPLAHVKTELLEHGLKFSGPNLCKMIIDGEHVIEPSNFVLPDIIEVRQKDQHWIYKTRSHWFLNRGGEKFSLEGLESALQQDIEVEAMCVSVPDERLGEDLGILITNTHHDLEDLKNNIMQCLKKKTHREFNRNNVVVVDRFPMNENLKKDRLKAQQMIRRQD